MSVCSEDSRSLSDLGCRFGADSRVWQQCGRRLGLKSGNCRYFSRERAIFSVFLGFKRKKALQVPTETDQRPLALHRLEAAQQELAKAQHVFDDAGDGFDRGLALGVAGLAPARAQPVRIELGRCGLICGHRRR